MEQTGVGVDTVVLEFKTHRLGGDIEGEILHDADDDFFEENVRGVVRAQAKIDPYIDAHLASGWSLKRLNSISRAILRSAAFEFIHFPDVPKKTVMNEYVEIAKSFFDQKETSFVNGVLDAIGNDIRGGDA